MLRRLLVVVVAVLMVGSASADVVLRVDFNSDQDGGGNSTTAGDPGLSAAAHNQEGWSSYHANHEVAAEFSTANYAGITVTPAWPNTTANTVQQSIDRGNNQNVPPTGNDANWDDTAGDLNLVTDFIGIDTRTGNGGNGNWDGTTGTPTYMTLTLGGLPAGAYEWTSFHHDTEHVHGPFAIWLSTDGGGTFTQLADGIMTDSTTGGTPDSGAPVSGPDVYSLASTYRTSFTASGTDDVVFRFASYSDAAGVHRQIWGMNGFVLELVSHDQAFGPTPTNGAPDVAKSVVLTWSPADDTAATNGHKIFLSDNFADVDAGLAAAERGVLSDPVFDTATLPFALEYSTTYYWRVDQASTPGGPWNPGEVWSFTAEPFAYAIENIIATASSSDSATTGPENTTNASGLDENDLHSTENTDMWLSASESAGQAWIEYKFDKVYKVHEMWVWNFNVEFEHALGYGLRDVTIECSTNGSDWTVLGGVPEFAQAPSSAGYAHNTPVDFGGAPAKYVKITANSNWGSLDQYGLSEVRFFYIPVRAKLPEPASGAADIDVDGVTLRWRAGREAASHDLYLSTDKRAVADGTVPPLTMAEASYDTGELDLGQTYYWKVNEINQAEDPGVWEGDLWDFATQDFLVVDDFEGYKGDEVPVTEQIWGVWRDGLGFGAVGVPPYYPGNGTGSEIGDATTRSYTEEGITHANSLQSMPFKYFNDGSTGKALYSETERTFDPAEDWTRNNVKALTLYFYGAAGNSPEQLYVALEDDAGLVKKVVNHPDLEAVQVPVWQEWNIALSEFSAAGVNLAAVKKMYIGLGNRDNPTADGTGTIYIDDIRLYPARCLPGLLKPAADLNNDCMVDYLDMEILANEWLGTGYEVTPVNPGSAGLVAHLAFDDGSGTTAQDSSGNNNHGTVMGGAQWVAGGKVGGALAFDGVDDIVVVEQNSGLPIYNNGTDNAYSVAMWVKGGPQPDLRVFSEGSTSDTNPLFNLGTQNTGATGQFDVYIRPVGMAHTYSVAEPFDYTWHHIGWVDADGTARLYVDGVLDGTDFSYTRAILALNTTSIGGILRATASHFFTGQIDDVHVYSRALSQAEVAGLAGRTSPFSEPFDMYQDGTVDFKDFAALADSWLDEELWPQP